MIIYDIEIMRNKYKRRAYNINNRNNNSLIMNAENNNMLELNVHMQFA